MRRLRHWQALKSEHGWAGISWPIAYGGRGATNIEEFIFAEEEAELFFLTAARVAESDVLGEVGGGFQVILATLGGERSHSGAVQGTGTTFEDLLDLARRQGRTTAPVDRQALVSAYIRSAVIRYLSYRIRSTVGQGHEPGPESSIMKLAFSQHASSTGNLMMALVGAGGMLSGRSAPDEGRWPNEFIEQIAQRIGGGTDEIQRNTIGERVLGLPPEPRMDKLLTFRQLLGGKG